MSNHSASPRLSRRRLLGVGGTAAAALALGRLTDIWKGPLLPTAGAAASVPSTIPPVNVHRHLAATDGWISLPGSIPTYSPDPLAPKPFTNYVFGFRDVTGMSDNLILAQKGHVQHSAPLLYFDELDSIQIDLTNLGLQQRPDLVDSHTIHWHGFRNALPIFDGVPEMSIDRKSVV